MSAIDRDALIEAAAKVMHSHRVHMARGVSDPSPPPTPREVDDATAVLPVIARELLAPLRKLHTPHPKFPSCTECHPSGYPCPTVRLLDQIEADVRGER